MTGQSDMPAYLVRVSARARRPSIRVTPRRGVEIVLPRGMSIEHGHALAARRREWIRQTVERLRLRGLAAWEQTAGIPDDICFQATGTRLTVTGRTLPADQAGYVRDSAEEGIVHMGCPEGAIPAQALHGWLINQGRKHLSPWLSALAMAHDLRYQRVRVAGQHTLWGSCSARGTISLNYRLLFMPPRLARYVMLHELAHLVHRNHSRRFWATLETMCPGAAVLDRELRSGARHVPAWVEMLRSR